MMKIDKKLNFVSTVNRESGQRIYLHVIPFPIEVVEDNCLLLGNIFNSFFSMVGSVGAPRVAGMMLRKALNSARERGEIPADAPTLIDDIQRLTSVVWLDTSGWRTAPLEVALKQGVIADEEYRDVEGEIVFFMVSSAIQKASLMAATVGKALEMYSGQLVSLNATAFRDSLPTSKAPTDTPTQEAPQALSHIPS